MMDVPGLLYLSNDDVHGLLDMRMAIECGERTLRDIAGGEVDWCERRQMQVKSPAFQTRIRAKSCLLRRQGVGGTRVFSINRTETGRQTAAARPTRVVLLTDAHTGALIAIVDEQWSLAVRTGAAVGIAARHLARRGEQATVGILGAGPIAETSLMAIREVCDVGEVRVYAPPVEERESYASRMSQQLELRVVPLASAEEAVRGSAIVCAATSAKEPFIRDEWLAPGSFLYSLGELQEAETEVYRRTDKLVVDDWEQVKLKADVIALLGSGELSESDVYAELADVVGGKRPGRESEEERIFMRSQGLVPQDIALAHAVYLAAIERGVGQPLSS